MRRARQNVEQLVERLPAYGFQFESDPLVNPSRDAATQLDALEVEVGVLPLALRAWFEEVGQVNLNGLHPEWTFEYPDPLVVDAPLEYVRSEYERWSADRGTEWEDGSTFEIPLAPDCLR